MKTRHLRQRGIGTDWTDVRVLRAGKESVI